MRYNSVITTAEAKQHLGVDDDSRDAEIERMVRTCLSKVESETNVHVIDKDKVYYYDNGCVVVYDYPINSTTSTTHEVTVKTLHSVYTDTETETITLNIGYSDPAQVPEGLKDMALILLYQLFHTGELKATPEYNLLKGQFKRFII